MYHWLAAHVREAQITARVDAAAGKSGDPHVLVSIDVKNAFNCLMSKQLLETMNKGYQAISQERPPPEPGLNDEEQCTWDILWPYVFSHYAEHSDLRYFHAGQQHIIASQSGVHQGDPLGSDLFALTIHPSLVKVADKHQRTRISGYADNLFLFGRAKYVADALEDLEKHLLEMGLTLNPADSVCFFPAGSNLSVFHYGENKSIPVAVSGIKILGSALGSAHFCEAAMQEKINRILGDLNVIKKVPSLHLQQKLVTYCCNNRLS